MPLIRSVRLEDLDSLYEVCLRTGDAGEDATGLYEDPQLLGEIYVGPYLSVPGTVGFTAVEDGVPSGYALAAIDTRRFEIECETAWWPALRARYPDPGPDPATRDQELIRMIHHPPRGSEEMVDRFPAHLHIDLLPALQGKGLGRVLMDRLLGDLVAREAPGVHLGVDALNTRAHGFYSHYGFATIGEGPGVVWMGLRL
jgi:ribosomal protein S18 acetylase RimI-like enzyme